MAEKGYYLDWEGPKDSENAPNSFLTKTNGFFQTIWYWYDKPTQYGRNPLHVVHLIQAYPNPCHRASQTQAYLKTSSRCKSTSKSFYTVMATTASKTFEKEEVVHFSIKLFCASRELGGNINFGLSQALQFSTTWFSSQTQ